MIGSPGRQPQARLHSRTAARRATVLATIMIVVTLGGWLAAQDLERLNVRVGPFPSRAAAVQALEKLAAVGIDAFLFPEARDGSVVISAGVFAVPENAVRMVGRVEELDLGPVAAVPLSQPVAASIDAGTSPDAADLQVASEHEVASEAADTVYEVRYGFFEDRTAAVPVYRELATGGFDPRLLVFSSSRSATIGCGVFETEESARRQLAELAAAGFPDGRIHRLSMDEAEARGVLPAAPPSEGELATVAEMQETPAEPSEGGTSPVPSQRSAMADREAPGPESTPTQEAAAGIAEPSSEDVVEAYRLTMDEAVRYAMEHSPELESESLGVDLSRTELRRARGLVQPKILFEHQSTRNDSDTVEYYNRLSDGANLLLDQLGLPPNVPPFIYEESHHTQLMLTQNLFSGGANRFRISGARASLDAARSRRDDREAEILMSVLQAFFNLARQSEVVGLRHESLERAERSLESVERRFSLGLVPRAEVLRWKVQVSGERVELIQARNLFEVGLEHFKRLIGYPPASPLALAFPPQEEVESLMQQGISELEPTASAGGAWLEDHPAVAAARHQAEAARFVRRASGADFWPTLDLDGSVGYLENDTLELDEFLQWSARLRLSFPVWDGGNRAQNRAEARTREDLADLGLRVTRDELFVQDRSVRADLNADLAALENARAAVTQARETMESVTNKAELGLVDYIERIDAQVILTQSLVAETSARYQFVIDLLRWWRIRNPGRLRSGVTP